MNEAKTRVSCSSAATRFVSVFGKDEGARSVPAERTAAGPRDSDPHAPQQIQLSLHRISQPSSALLNPGEGRINIRMPAARSLQQANIINTEHGGRKCEIDEQEREVHDRRDDQEAITAGSKPSFLPAAAMWANDLGKADRHDHRRAGRQMRRDTSRSRSLTAALNDHDDLCRSRQRPGTRRKDGHADFLPDHMPRGPDRGTQSFRLMPRIIDTQACEPELPPVSISIGIDMRHGRAASEFSNFVMTIPPGTSCPARKCTCPAAASSL